MAGVVEEEVSAHLMAARPARTTDAPAGQALVRRARTIDGWECSKCPPCSGDWSYSGRAIPARGPAEACPPQQP